MLPNEARFEKQRVFSRRELLRLPEQPDELWPHLVACWPLAALLIGAANVAAVQAREWWRKRGGQAG